ncbi:MAG: sigma-70 family RNA polymerase sigma factor [Comamonadaceae bacterium]|nr:MAG: sigma-70 family RNA polymerase sigma factor [Comamonadaceae bacterium]
MALDTQDLQMIALIDRIAARNTGSTTADAEKALRELYDLTSSKLFGVALRVAGKRDWAEDVLQEAFLNIWRIAGDYRAALSPPMAWMGVIVRSRALDFLRRRTSERADSVQELDDFINDTVAGDGANPMDTTQASEQAWALHECLRKLDAKQREVVSLAYMRDLSHGELAEQLKLPLGTVKTWIRRGLEQLRGCMASFA